MTLDARQYFPLNTAYLCQDCDSVGNNSMRCPACASEVLISLASVFARQEEMKAAAEEQKLLLVPAMAA